MRHTQRYRYSGRTSAIHLQMHEHVVVISAITWKKKNQAHQEVGWFRDITFRQFRATMVSLGRGERTSDCAGEQFGFGVFLCSCGGEHEKQLHSKADVRNTRAVSLGSANSQDASVTRNLLTAFKHMDLVCRDYIRSVLLKTSDFQQALTSRWSLSLSSSTYLASSMQHPPAAPRSPVPVPGHHSSANASTVHRHSHAPFFSRNYQRCTLRASLYHFQRESTINEEG